jgi:hypothetical protein
MGLATSSIPSRVVACGLLTLAAATPVTAQDGPSMTIDGFRGLTWGASASEVTASLGAPVESRRVAGGLQMLAYRDTLAGRPSVVLLGLLDDEGLVKGQEVVPAGGGDECIEYIRAVHQAVNLRFPLIRPNEQAKNNSRDTICEAAAEGLAFWYRQWRDEETGSVVTVRLDSGSDEVNLVYESQAFRTWAQSGAPGAPGAGNEPRVPDQGRATADEVDPAP